jgi:hypothetical protein
VAEIEFLTPGAAGASLGPPDEIGGEVRAPKRWHALRASGRFSGALLGTLGLLAAAAALPVMAAFRTIYTVRQFGSNGGGFTYWVDGWGRYRPAAAHFPAGVHEPRAGLVLVGCAAGFALLALLVAATALPEVARRVVPRLATLVLAASAGLSGLLAGTLASMALQIDSLSANLRVEAGADRGFGSPHFRVTTGGCLWLGLAGLAAGVLAIGAVTQLRRVWSADAEPPGKLT